MNFKLKEPFNMYKKCSKCDFELCVSSPDEEATVGDWQYCPKCGHKTKIYKKDLEYWV